MNYTFPACSNMLEVKQNYFNLVSEARNNGDLQAVEEITKQYFILCDHFTKEPQVFRSGKKFTPKKKTTIEEIDDGYLEIVSELLKLQDFLKETESPDKIEISACGAWLWVTGDTKNQKDALKSIGLFYSSNKKCWYWRPESAKNYRGKGKTTLAEIRLKYGYKVIEDEEDVNTIEKTA